MCFLALSLVEWEGLLEVAETGRLSRTIVSMSPISLLYLQRADKSQHIFAENWDMIPLQVSKALVSLLLSSIILPTNRKITETLSSEVIQLAVELSEA